MAQFGFGFVPFPSEPLTAIECGVLAEKCGFDALWIPDTFVDIEKDATYFSQSHRALWLS